MERKDGEHNSVPILCSNTSLKSRVLTNRVLDQIGQEVIGVVETHDLGLCCDGPFQHGSGDNVETVGQAAEAVLSMKAVVCGHGGGTFWRVVVR